VPAADCLHQAEAVHARHLQVGHDQVGHPSASDDRARDSDNGHADIEAGIFQKELHLRSLRWAVLEHENTRHVRASLWEPSRAGGVWNRRVRNGVGKVATILPAQRAHARRNPVPLICSEAPDHRARRRLLPDPG
jgi:hypothetical protein